MSTRDSDKDKPYIPHNSLKQDGYSKEGEATATCYCGAVQLAFVSSCSSGTMVFLYHKVLMLNAANHRPRPRRHLRLPLHRLPKDHSVSFHLSLHCRSFSCQAHPRPGQPEEVLTVSDDCFWPGDDELFLRYMWNAHVPAD